MITLPFELHQGRGPLRRPAVADQRHDGVGTGGHWKRVIVVDLRCHHPLPGTDVEPGQGRRHCPRHRPGMWVCVMTTKPQKTSPPSSTSRDLNGEVAFLTRPQAPTLRDAIPRLAERARAESWTHEEFVVACLQREVSARESHGGEGRIRAARSQHASRVRLRTRPRPQTRPDRASGHRGLRRRERERRLPRPTRHRLDPPCDRAGHPGLQGPPPQSDRHRVGVGGPARRGPLRPPRPIARPTYGRGHPPTSLTCGGGRSG
jgi:hypothetical protein